MAPAVRARTRARVARGRFGPAEGAASGESELDCGGITATSVQRPRRSGSLLRLPGSSRLIEDQGEPAPRVSIKRLLRQTGPQAQRLPPAASVSAEGRSRTHASRGGRARVGARLRGGSGSEAAPPLRPPSTESLWPGLRAVRPQRLGLLARGAGRGAGRPHRLSRGPAPPAGDAGPPGLRRRGGSMVWFKTAFNGYSVSRRRDSFSLEVSADRSDALLLAQALRFQRRPPLRLLAPAGALQPLCGHQARGRHGAELRHHRQRPAAHS